MRQLLQALVARFFSSRRCCVLDSNIIDCIVAQSEVAHARYGRTEVCRGSVREPHKLVAYKTVHQPRVA